MKHQISFLKAAIVFSLILSSCGKDRKLDSAKSVVESAITTHFFKLNDGTHVTLYEGSSGLTEQKCIIQLKGLDFDIDSMDLEEADEMNGISWKGICKLKYSAMRILDLNSRELKWRDWRTGSLDDGGIIWVNEKDGKFIVDSAYIDDEVLAESYDFDNCTKNKNIHDLMKKANGSAEKTSKGRKKIVAVAKPNKPKTTPLQNNSTTSVNKQAKPTILRLVGAEIGESLIELRWKGRIPSMKMNTDGKNFEWIKGDEVEHDVFQFAKDKFYQLTLHFPHKAFIENGFDGAPLDTVTGAFTFVR